ncbi:MAG: LytTR family DNA-binding domain-containing protein [Saprospiraceae bacterium]|nr:LytTR family DNA-binding domain-containing protein [Saprospiraceae bacterium]MDW8228718.1 LytTR family DNA-binding domain-containing protein [Saprospiraceae bacterium]
MPFKIAIVDDEPAARAALKRLLQQRCPQAVVAGEAGSVAEGLAMLRQVAPDLLLLDVEMEDGSGFDLLEQARPLSCAVAFVTAHDEFAVRAFRCNAVDYLLKPINPDELAAAVQKAQQGIEQGQLYQRIEALLHAAALGRIERITLNTSKGLLFVALADIACVESCGNYAFVHLASGERHLDARNLKEYEEILPHPAFVRTHQSFIVQVALVQQWLKGEEDDLVLSTGMRVPVARRRREALLRLLA